MNRNTLILVLLLAGVGLIIAIVVSLLHDGLSATATPTKLEALLARNVRHLSIPAKVRAEQNPLLATPANLQDARRHFADHCAVCHANTGSGDATIGKGLYPKPPDLREPATQDLSDGELYWIIENGVRFTGMPSFSNHTAAGDSWKLVLFIRHLPQLTAEERLEMRRYNPKNPEDREQEKQENDFLNGAPSLQKSASPQHP
jgi:mono/diheme cytochrome c family protein